MLLKQLPKWFSRLVLLLLLLFVSLVGIGLLSISIPTFGPISFEAHEAANRNNLVALNNLINLYKSEYGKWPSSQKELENYLMKNDICSSEMFSDLLVERPSDQNFDFLLPSTLVEEKIIIVGHEKDQNQLVWALTESGKIIKIVPEMVRKFHK